MNYKNQLKIFNPEEYENTSLTIIGVGSVGSFTVLVLGKMGIKTIIILDEDTIEEHNISNQFYKLSQVGDIKKTDALQEIMLEFTETNIKKSGFLTKDSILISDIIIATTDSMSSRKLAYEKSKQFARFFIDARMNGHTYRVYTVDLNNKNHCKEYEKTLYSDEEADEGECTEKTIIYNVVDIASKIGNQVRKVLTKQKYSNFLAFDFVNDIFMKRRWE